MMLVLQKLSTPPPPPHPPTPPHKKGDSFCFVLGSIEVQTRAWRRAKSGMLTIKPRSYLSNREAVKITPSPLYFTERLVRLSNLQRYCVT